jgi:hypothetical protein
MPIELAVLDLSHVNDPVVSREDAAVWGFTHLNELWNPTR